MAKQYIQFLSGVQPSVPGCDIATAISALRASAIDFCAESLIWRREADPTDIAADVSEYSFSPPTGAEVVTVMNILVDGNKVTPVSREDLDTYRPSWRDIAEKIPQYYFLTGNSTLRLVGVPTEDLTDALRVDVVLKPSRSSTEVPDTLYEDWFEPICAGALYRLQVMPDKTWTNGQLASYNLAQFRNGVTQAKNRRIRSRTLAARTIKPVKFGSW